MNYKWRSKVFWSSRSFIWEERKTKGFITLFLRISCICVGGFLPALIYLPFKGIRAQTKIAFFCHLYFSDICFLLDLSFLRSKLHISGKKVISWSVTLMLSIGLIPFILSDNQSFDSLNLCQEIPTERGMNCASSRPRHSPYSNSYMLSA